MGQERATGARIGETCAARGAVLHGAAAPSTCSPARRQELTAIKALLRQPRTVEPSKNRAPRMKDNPLIHRPSGSPEVPRWTETLRDRSQVLIRPLQAQDRAAEAAFIEGLSLQARRYRFLGQVASPSEELVEHLVDLDFVHDVAFAATVHEEGRDRIVGVARYSVDPDGATCECAVTVAEAWQERGLGTVLMRHLIEVARARGIRSMYSIDAVENVGMRELAAHLGFRTRLDPRDPTLYVHRLELQGDGTVPL